MGRAGGRGLSVVSGKDYLVYRIGGAVGVDVFLGESTRENLVPLLRCLEGEIWISNNDVLMQRVMRGRRQ